MRECFDDESRINRILISSTEEETRVKKIIYRCAHFFFNIVIARSLHSCIPKPRRICLKRFTNFPSRRIIIPRKNYIRALISHRGNFFFSYVRPNALVVGPIGIANALMYALTAFVNLPLYPGNFSSSSLSRRNFNLGNIFPGREVPIHIFFSFFPSPFYRCLFINAREKNIAPFFSQPRPS